ncbi:hypothetical protein BDK51DRAFT_33084 [Blyttiomyces helicus]|uniref:Uncharacterized protein n=1 Tax=Blyttiomyces helicus TaxID=388810 RepID=A0A4P9W921_9FUNG|nr:hypothetical protein BDK51DRAFT_33084 [Blyttiomyces helicus]|eukprot:RKO87598.1 hypothetical protein BDK51DRAFT_33084 [Blyttiomyces helicus]
MQPFTLFALLSGASLVAAQSSCLQDTLTGFLTGTCNPLQTGVNAAKVGGPKNATYYQICLCYQALNLDLCYIPCASNTTIAPTYAEAQAHATQVCSDAGYSPNLSALPSPPIWETVIPTTTTIQPTITPTAISATATAAATGAGTATGTATGPTSTSSVNSKSNDAPALSAQTFTGLVSVGLVLVVGLLF